MSTGISIPPSHLVEECILYNLEIISTKGQNNLVNGDIASMINIAIPGTLPVELVYIIRCTPGSIKGPHVHLPPKWDRFSCVKGTAIIVCRNEQTGIIKEYRLYDEKPNLLVIPPYNSHAVCSKHGCTILSICSERYHNLIKDSPWRRK